MPQNKNSKPRYAFYGRISKDPTGTSTAPDRQLKECRSLARDKGIDIVETYIDTDLSGYQRGVIRPRYEEMLEAIADGAFDGVIVWKLDRLMRRIVEFSRFWAIAGPKGADITLISKNDTIDTTNPIGLAIVYLLVGLAEQESFNTSTRAKAKETELAAAGVHKFAGRRAYGVRPPTLEEVEAGAGPKDWQVEPDEAAVIVDCADRVLAGESIPSLVRDLNERGVPSATGKRWSRRALQTLLVQARLFGWREHHGELIAKGDWPCVLDEATGRKLRQVLPPAAGQGREVTRRRYLLSGLLKCGKCGSSMKAGSGVSNGQSMARYICPPKSDGGCNGTTIERVPTDSFVGELALYRLNSPNVASMLKARKTKRRTADDAEILIELAGVSDRMEQLANDYAKGGEDALPLSAYKAATQALEKRSDELNNRLAVIRQAEPLAKLVDGNDGLGATWELMTDDRRRAVLDVVLEKVIVHGADSDWYRERLAETLLIQAKEARGVGDERTAKRRRKQAVDRLGEAAVATMEAAIEADAEAVDGGTSSRSYRPERIEPIWRV